jgi:hypothetical protein
VISLVCLIPKLWLKKLDVWGSFVIVLSFTVAFSFVQTIWWQTFPPVDTTYYLLWSLPLILMFLNLPVKLVASGTDLLALPRKIPFGSLALNISLCLIASGYAYLVILPLEKFNTLSKILCSLVFALIWQGLAYGLNLDPTLSNKSIQGTFPNWLRFVIFASVTLSSGILFFFGSSVQLAQQAMILAMIQFSLLILCWRQQSPQNILWLNAWILSALWLNSLLFSSAKIWYLVTLFALLSPLLLKLKPVQKLPVRWQYSLLLTLGLGLQIALLAYVWLQQGQDLYLG